MILKSGSRKLLPKIPRVSGGQPGGHHSLIGSVPVRFLFLLLLGASLACALPGKLSSPTSTPIPTFAPATTEDIQELQQQLATASTQFAETGKLEITLTEQQLDGLLAGALSEQPDLQITEAQISLQNGQIQFLGKTALGKLTVPVQITFQPTVADGLLKVEVVSANFGEIPIPDKFLAQLSELVNNNLNENLTVEGRQILIQSVEISDGRLTVTGKAR